VLFGTANTVERKREIVGHFHQEVDVAVTEAVGLGGSDIERADDVALEPDREGSARANAP